MVISSSQQGELEARFQHLLQPIRDLTRNWNIDIAHQLEDYLVEIESISITFDGGKTTLNFAEAALLIQGSACIYSKKVEYLHGLVYQVLDLLASKKKLQQAASLDADGNDKDANFPAKRDDDEFLSLDDVKEHKNRDLKGDLENANQSIAVLPRLTLSLIPLAEGEKGENPLISPKGEVLGSRNDFKMNTCNIHPLGTLLLDLSHLNLLELSIQRKPCSTPFIQRVRFDDDSVPPGGKEGESEDMAVDEGLPQELSFDDNDGGLPLLDEGPDLEGPLPETDHLQKEAMQLRRSERTKNLIARPPNKPDIDLWSPLEPHQVTTSEKAFKKKKTYQITQILEPEGTKKRKRNKQTEPGTKRLTSISDFCTKAFYSRSAQFPRNPLKAPTFPEFEQLYWKEFKLRQAKLRNDRKRLEEAGRVQELEEELAAEAENDNYNEPPPGLDNDDDDDNDFHRVDFQIPEVNDLGPLQPADMIPGGDIFPDHEDAWEDVPVVGSYEELVRKHVEGYLASAQQYAQVTELSRRVTEWEEKIIPKLQEEEEHGPFDIHKYGSDVLTCLKATDNPPPNKQEKIPFRRVCHNKAPYQVCRLFLSTLQLANNYNVEISSEGTLSAGMDTMALRMLSETRHFEELQEYRAPSVDH